MFARSTTVRGNPLSMDDAIAYVRDEVMPAVQQMDGCIGLSMLCDRDTGRCIATTAWETEEAMHDSESGVHDLRMRMAEMMGGRPEIQEWEIAVMHRMREAPEGACARVTWARGDPALIDDRMSTMRTAMLPRVEELPGFCSVAKAARLARSSRWMTAGPPLSPSRTWGRSCQRVARTSSGISDGRR